jgi:hypothetical protein
MGLNATHAPQAATVSKLSGDGALILRPDGGITQFRPHDQNKP